MVGNGCETDLFDDPLHCGVCGNTCDATGPNVDGPACDDGACALHCVDGFDDCGPGAGCETPTSSDPLNCGGEFGHAGTQIDQAL